MLILQNRHLNYFQLVKKYFCFAGGSRQTMNAYHILLEVGNASTRILNKYYISLKTASLFIKLTVVKGKPIVKYQFNISVNYGFVLILQINVIEIGLSLSINENRKVSDDGHINHTTM